MEDKKINFPQAYYEEHNLLQTPTGFEKEKQQGIDDYLKLASAYFEEHIQRLQKNINEENYRNLIFSEKKKKKKIENDLIVNDKPTFGDCLSTVNLLSNTLM